MENEADRHSQIIDEPRSVPERAAPGGARAGSPAATPAQAYRVGPSTAPAIAPAPETQAKPPAAGPSSHRLRKWLLLAGAAVGLAIGGYP